MARFVIEEPCRDGEYEAHYLTRAQIEVREAEGAYIDEMGDPACDGGSRRVLDPGSYVLIERNERDSRWMVPPALPGWTFMDYTKLQLMLSDVADALAGGEQP